jgi:hypothetical protein
MMTEEHLWEPLGAAGSHQASISRSAEDEAGSQESASWQAGAVGGILVVSNVEPIPMPAEPGGYEQSGRNTV